MKKLIILDTNALVHRAYHALPPLKTSQGKTVNAVYGVFSVLIRLLEELSPDCLMAAFDVEGKTFRDRTFADYKAGRTKPPQEMYDQIPLIKRGLGFFGADVLEKKGFEADDIIGTVVKETERASEEIGVFIVTGDLDALQLINSWTSVYFLQKGVKNGVIYDKEKVKERYQIRPEQIVDLKALKGDSSDNIPGVAGIGEKTAIDLIKKFNSLEEIYQNIETLEVNPKIKSRLLEYREDAFLSYRLASIYQEVPLEISLNCGYKEKLEKERLFSLFKDLGFQSLIKRFYN